MADLSGIKMQKQLAMGGSLPEGNFGVEPLSSHSAGGPAGNTAGGHLKDDERAARSPIDGNQANPDHGWKK